VQLLKAYSKKDVESKNAQDKRTLAVNIEYNTGRTGCASGLRIQGYNTDITEYPGT
jgi:hypothetical protein